MRTINTCNKEYELYWVTGQVLESGKNMETRVHGSGGGSYGNGYTAPVNVSSTTIVHDQLFVMDKQGKEHAFQLQDFHLACRDGNEVTVLWAIRKGKKTGPYFVVHNRTTSQTFYQEKVMGKIFSYALIYPIGISILCLFLWNILPFAFLWLIAPFVIWFILRKKEISHFKSTTDFTSFN
ncbi:MAG TPA: hypothetical protein VHD83_24485 [Puia sp.]|nr:hypothetical protein [Puia sp.]